MAYCTAQVHDARIRYRHDNNVDEYIGKIYEALSGNSFDLYLSSDGEGVVFRWDCVGRAVGRGGARYRRGCIVDTVSVSLIQHARRMLGSRFPE